jgi:hypothetical protein
MTRQRFVPLLVAALVVICGALYLAAKRNQTQDTTGVALFPALAGEVNAITALTVRKGGSAPTVTVHKTGDAWAVAERAEYPADVTKIRKLVLALRDAKIIEEKTADPARFSAIGVEDPTVAGATGAEITVEGPGFRHGVIVGKPVGDGDFVRRAGETRSYSIEPAISVDTEPRFWIDTRLLDVPVALLQGVAVKPADGPGYSLHRLNPADNTYSLDGVPPGRKALDGHALAPGSTTFTGVTAEDVAPVASVDFGHASQAVITLSDGNIITLSGVVQADKHWITLTASKDAALTTRAQGRAFEIAGYRYDAIWKPLDQLLVPKGPAAGPAAAGPAAGAPQGTPAKSAPGRSSAAPKTPRQPETPASVP